MDNLKIGMLVLGPVETNCYLAMNTKTKQILVVDPADRADDITYAAREMGGEILINSDAHQKELLNGAFDQAVDAAVRCGFTHVNILTKQGSGKLHFRQLPLDRL